jgi:hypothetical protein
MAVNALTQSSIKNVLEGAEIQKLGLTNAIDTTAQGEINYLNNVLKYSTIKRACCLHNAPSNTATSFFIPVRIPLPIDKKFEDYGTGVKDIYKKYNFVDVQVNIPRSVCANPELNFTSTPNTAFINGTTVCNDFMKTYCKNISKQFKIDNDLTADSSIYPVDFPIFKPECACYAEIPDSIDKLNITPVCSVIGCEKESLSVYHAPFLACNATICQNIVKLDNVDAKDISLMPKMVNNCSGSAPIVTVPVTTVPNPPGVSAPANGTGSTGSTGSTDSDADADSNTVAPLTNEPGLFSKFFGSNNNRPKQQSSALQAPDSNFKHLEIEEPKDTSSSTSIILVIIVVLVIIIGVVIFFVMRRKKNNPLQTNSLPVP